MQTGEAHRAVGDRMIELATSADPTTPIQG